MIDSGRLDGRVGWSDYLFVVAWDVHETVGGVQFMLMLRVMADESHDSKRGSVITMAGLLASSAVWERFWVDWQTALDDAGLSGRTFHSADCANGAGVFARWPAPQREALQRRLLATVVDPAHGLIGYSATMSLQGHQRLRPRFKPLMTLPPEGAISGALDDPWFFVLQALVLSLVRDLARFPQGEKVGFIFDRHHLSARGRVIYSAIAMWPKSEARLEGGVAFQDKAKMVPLQAADLFAYETFRYFNDTHLGGHPERWQHKEMRKVVQFAHYLDADALSKMLAQYEPVVIANRQARGRPVAPTVAKASKTPYTPTLLARVRRIAVRLLRRVRRRVRG